MRLLVITAVALSRSAVRGTHESPGGTLISLGISHTKIGEVETPEMVIGADVDGDGLDEVVSAGSDVRIHRNESGGWSSTVVASAESFLDFTLVAAADVDSDGDVDLVVGGLTRTAIEWFENVDGAGHEWALHSVFEVGQGARSIRAVDVDSDGDVDLIVANFFKGNVVALLNDAGNGEAWSLSSLNKGWPSSGVVDAAVADFDGDSKPDLFMTSFDTDILAWIEYDVSEDGAVLLGETWKIVSEDVLGARAALAADMDGDGDVDIVSAEWSDSIVAWYENVDGDGESWTKHIIATDAYSVYQVFLQDVNADGAIDVLAANFGDDSIVWYVNDNTDPDTGFWEQIVVAKNVEGAASVYSTDLDGDGLVDVISAAQNADTVQWHDLHLAFKPTPTPTFSPWPTALPSSTPSRAPTPLPTDSWLKPSASPTIPRTGVPSAEPTREEPIPWRVEYRYHIIAAIALVGTAFYLANGLPPFCCCGPGRIICRPLMIRLEPYYLPQYQLLMKRWKKSRTRRFLCFCCPLCCRGEEDEDPLNPSDGVELKPGYIPVRVVHDAPRSKKHKIRFVKTGTRELTLV